MKYVLSVCALFITGFVYAQQPAFITDSLDTYVQREMQRWNIPGVAIAIVKDGKTVVVKGYGVTDTETKHKVDENTLFMIASNSKLFTGTSLALLQEQGRMQLDDKVQKWVPYFNMYTDTLTKMVTVEDILSHRLGFETFQGDFYNWANSGTREDIIKNIARNKPVYDFRDTYGYCNSGFVTAGEVIHAVSDTTWEQFIQTHFFGPLNMSRSSIGYDAIHNDKNACIPYTMFMDKMIKMDHDHLDNIAPCAGINSCAKDLANWLQFQLADGAFNGKQIMPAEVLQETRIPRTIVSDGRSGLVPSQRFDLYGLGEGINDIDGKVIYSHTGGADGFVTTVGFIPDEQLGVVVLTNTDVNYFFLAAFYQIIEAYMNDPYRNISQLAYGYFSRSDNAANQEINDWYALAAKTPHASLPLSNYTGSYTNSVYGKMEIKEEKGKLVMHFEHHPQLTGTLQPIGENDFVCTYDPIAWGVKEIPFEIVDGKVSSVTVTINDFIDFMPYEFIKQ